MKKTLAILFMMAIALFIKHPMTAAADYSFPAQGTEFNVASFGADGKDTLDDRAAFQAALDKALTTSGTVTVTVPAGTYYFDSHLLIYSSTVFRLDSGAVLKSTHNNDYIMVHGQDPVSVQKNKNFVHNITISGGTWDSNNTDPSVCKGLLKICNASDIKLLNVTFKNVVGTHFVILDGITGGLISGCTFCDFRDFTGTNEAYNEQVFAGLNYWSAEALHIDFIPKNSLDLNGRPYVPSSNIEVAGCTFRNLPSALGTHHVFDYMTQDNIYIHDNSFVNCYYDCINATSFKSFRCINNTASNCGGFLVCRRTSGNVYNNKATLLRSPSGWWYGEGKWKGTGSPSFYGIEVSDGSDLTLSGNTVNSASSQGIAVIGSNATLINNVVNGSRSNGVCIWSGSRVSMTSNRVSNSGLNGISVKNSSTLSTMLRNTVIRAGNNGVYAYSSTISDADNNTVKNCSYNGFSLSSSRGYIHNNTVCYCTDNGFYLSNGSNCTADGNLVNANSKSAFVVVGSAAKITGNTMYSNGSLDLHVRSGSINVVYQNNGSDKKQTKVDSGCSAAISGSRRALRYSQFTVQSYIPYSGKAARPSVTSSLVLNRDYTVNYGNYTSTGRAKVIITGKGSYTGTLVYSYRIIPGKLTLNSVTAVGSGSAQLKWTRNGAADGYTAYVSETPGMQKSTSFTRTGNLSAMNVYGLVKGKTYYVQICGYSEIDGVRYNGAMSVIRQVVAK